MELIHKYLSIETEPMYLVYPTSHLCVVLYFLAPTEKLKAG